MRIGKNWSSFGAAAEKLKKIEEMRASRLSLRIAAASFLAACRHASVVCLEIAYLGWAWAAAARTRYFLLYGCRIKSLRQSTCYLRPSLTGSWRSAVALASGLALLMRSRRIKEEKDATTTNVLEMDESLLYRAELISALVGFTGRCIGIRFF
jgi:hypothetical protein